MGGNFLVISIFCCSFMLICLYIIQFHNLTLRELNSRAKTVMLDRLKRRRVAERSYQDQTSLLSCLFFPSPWLVPVSQTAKRPGVIRREHEALSFCVHAGCVCVLLSGQFREDLSAHITLILPHASPKHRASVVLGNADCFPTYLLHMYPFLKYLQYFWAIFRMWTGRRILVYTYQAYGYCVDCKRPRHVQIPIFCHYHRNQKTSPSL